MPPFGILVACSKDRESQFDQGGGVSTTVTVLETTVGSACGEYVPELEDSAIDRARSKRGSSSDLCSTIVRIRSDTESLTRQARNRDDELAIIAAINRFYIIALFGATDRRCTC